MAWCFYRNRQKQNTMAKTKTKSSRGGQSRTRRPTGKSRSKTTSNANGSLLEEYFMDALKDIYWAEKALTKALPRKSKAATSDRLKKDFDQNL